MLNVVEANKKQLLMNPNYGTVRQQKQQEENVLKSAVPVYKHGSAVIHHV